jgi:hypothetical protein
LIAECDKLHAEATRQRAAARKSAAEAAARKQDLDNALAVITARRLPRQQQLVVNQLLAQSCARLLPL